jgi:hypothetical protein
MVNMPTRSRVEAWRVDHLEAAAAAWQQQTILTEHNYGRALQVREPGQDPRKARPPQAGATDCKDRSRHHRIGQDRGGGGDQ